MLNYNDKTFGMVTTSTGASNETVFHYRQMGDVVWGAFEGGSVRMGTFVASADADGVLDLRYAFVADGGLIHTGVSRSTPEVLADGRIRLYEDFYFTSGDCKKGFSIVEEVERLPGIGPEAPGQSAAVNAKSKIAYDGKRFASVANTPNGEVTGDTRFDYHQHGDVAWAEYEGGAIRKGMLVAVVEADGVLDMRYQHVNVKGELMTGACRSIPEVLADGRIRLHEAWHWTCGDQSSGRSVVEEIK